MLKKSQIKQGYANGGGQQINNLSEALSLFFYLLYEHHYTEFFPAFNIVYLKMFCCGCLYFAGVGFNFAMDADQRGVILTRAADPAEEIVNIHGGWSSQINLQTFDFE